jgi:diacylglycerol kinase family enzyme
VNQRKFIVFYNNQSTRSDSFDPQVRTPLDKYCRRTGANVTYLTVLPNFDDTIKYIASSDLVKDGDTVIAAGGDGTLSAVFNGLIKGGKAVDFVVLPLGQSNDMTGSFGGRDKFLDIVSIVNSPTIDYQALDLKINDRRLYYALHEWGVGHLANIGERNDRLQRIAKAKGKKINVPIEVFTYYRKEAVPNPTANLPAYTDLDGQRHKYSVISALLGRIGGVWFPRVDGRIAKSLHSSDELAVVNVNIKGNPLIDIPKIIKWVARGLPAKRVKKAKFIFERPIKEINVMVDGENFTVRDIKTISTRRVPTKVKLHVPAKTV